MHLSIFGRGMQNTVDVDLLGEFKAAKQKITCRAPIGTRTAPSDCTVGRKYLQGISQVQATSFMH